VNLIVPPAHADQPAASVDPVTEPIPTSVLDADVPDLAGTGRRSLGSIVVRAQNLTCRYDDHTAVDDVYLTLRAGTVTSVVGPRGSGKSTLLAAIAGRHEPIAGIVTLDDHPPGSPDAMARTGYLPQQSVIPAHLTGRQALAVLARAHPCWDAALVSDLTELLGLTRSLSRPLGTYSPGMTRTLHLITSLAHRPALWILDEPDTALDPLTLAGLARRLTRTGGTVLTATSHLSTVVGLADEVAVLVDGQLARAGSMSGLVPGTGTLAQAYEELSGQAVRSELTTQVLRTLDLSPALGPNDANPSRFRVWRALLGRPRPTSLDSSSGHWPARVPRHR
jgi:ABC-2 type transport system ATP-binding protein